MQGYILLIIPGDVAYIAFITSRKADVHVAFLNTYKHSTKQRV